jgi:hypothetical protein
MSAAERHLRAAQIHAVAAELHDAASRHWTERGDTERAVLEQRKAVIERGAAELECERARLADE